MPCRKTGARDWGLGTRQVSKSAGQRASKSASAQGQAAATFRVPGLWRTKGETWRMMARMGAERFSTVRQIRSGQICALCKASLPPPRTIGEQLCAKCRGERKRHRVYMSFARRDGWWCEFLEEDLSTHLPRKLTFKTHGKVRELAERGGCALNL